MVMMNKLMGAVVRRTVVTLSFHVASGRYVVDAYVDETCLSCGTFVNVDAAVEAFFWTCQEMRLI